MSGETGDRTELCHKYRPKTLAQFVGQDAAVAALSAKLAEGSLSRVVLLFGTSGTGKTSAARAVAAALGATEVYESNCADYRSIDDMREIRDGVKLWTPDGRPRVWILDEVVQLPKATQQAFLKLLEDATPIDYFLLCASETQGLLPTFLSRCLRVEFKTLSPADLHEICRRALGREGRQLTPEVVRRAVEVADGNARDALNSLELALSVKTPAEQLALLGEPPGKKAEFLAKLFTHRRRWADFAAALAPLTDQQAESLRRQTVDYLRKCCCGARPEGHHFVALQKLLDRDYVGTAAGLTMACYEFHQAVKAAPRV